VKVYIIFEEGVARERWMCYKFTHILYFVVTECYNGSSELAVDLEHIMLNSTLATHWSSNCRKRTKNVSIFISVKGYENDWKFN
jgi:hypothetical protein